jgi:hypothetical protein
MTRLSARDVNNLLHKRVVAVSVLGIAAGTKGEITDSRNAGSWVLQVTWDYGIKDWFTKRELNNQVKFC